MPKLSPSKTSLKAKVARLRALRHRLDASEAYKAQAAADIEALRRRLAAIEAIEAEANLRPVTIKSAGN